jgi:hypothetical protein
LAYTQINLLGGGFECYRVLLPDAIDTVILPAVPPSSVPSLLHDPPNSQKGRTSQPATTVRPRSITATTARQALRCCFATLMIADQSKTHDISGNLPTPDTGACYRP